MENKTLYKGGTVPWLLSVCVEKPGENINLFTTQTPSSEEDQPGLW